MSILLAPHQDDESLFCAAIILRWKPHVIVCTDSWIQYNRGQRDITPTRRREESLAAVAILDPNHTVEFLGIPDDRVDRDSLVRALRNHSEGELVFAPARQGGNPHHDLVSSVAEDMFHRVIYYATYAKGEWYTPLVGGFELVLTPQERALKEAALACYTSQHFQPHFAAVRASGSEWISKEPPNDK